MLKGRFSGMYVDDQRKDSMLDERVFVQGQKWTERSD